MISQYEVKMSPNLFLTGLLMGLLFLAEMVIWSINFYLILKIILSLGLIFYAIYAVNRYYFLSSQKSIQKINWSARDGWSIGLSLLPSPGLVSLAKFLSFNALIPWQVCGIHPPIKTVPAVLLDNSIFTSNIIILNFKIPSGKIRSAILFLCKKNQADFRQLIRIKMACKF